MLHKRILKIPNKTDLISEQKKWLDSTYAVLAICNKKEFLNKKEIEKRAFNLYYTLEKKGGAFRWSAVHFLDKLLANDMVEPKKYSNLASALLELSRSVSDPDSSLSLWIKSWFACNTFKNSFKKRYKECCDDLCGDLARILDNNFQLPIPRRDSLLHFWEHVGIQYCDQDDSTQLWSILKVIYSVDGLVWQRKADSLWLISNISAKDFYRKALIWDKGLAHSAYRLALIDYLDNQGIEAKELLKRAMKIDTSKDRQQLYKGFQKLIDSKYKDAVKLIQKATDSLPNDPDASYCLALAEKLRADELINRGDLCHGVNHLELSMSAYGLTLLRLDKDWQNLRDNRILQDSIIVHTLHAQIVKPCLLADFEESIYHVHLDFIREI